MRHRIAIGLAVVIGIAFCHGAVFGQNTRPINFAITSITLATGVGIFFNRTWSFYAACVILTLNLFRFVMIFPTRDMPYYYVTNNLAFIGVPVAVSYRLIVLGFLLATVWTHWQLRINGDLKKRISFGTHRKRLYAIACVSGLLIVSPVVLFVYGMIVDPPTASAPAVPSGGILPAIAIYLGIPMWIAGAVGLAVVYYFYQRGSRSREQDCD